MGLSASQSRYLQLTARRSDYEYRAQQINHSRLQLADKMQTISKAYSEGMSNRRMMFNTYSEDGVTPKQVRLDYNTITADAPNGLGFKLVNASGIEIRPEDYKNKSVLLADTEKNGQKTSTKVTGENFASLFKNDIVLDKNGTFVSMEQLGKKVSKMSATELHDYWNENGYNFASGNKLNSCKAIELENTRSVYDDRCLNSDYLEEKLRSGEWSLQKIDVEKSQKSDELVWENVHFSSISQISDELDTTDDAKVNAEYQAKLDFFAQKDKELELELQQIDSAHKAIETEIDSVSKVIKNNVTKTFKTFG